MDPALTESVLEKLGFSSVPDSTLPELARIYAAWCERVPFDNVRKLIHLRNGETGPLPGDTSDDFFRAWLTHGCGGTCWAGNGALHDLLASLGFHAQRAVATMVVAPDLPPNHGSVVASFGESRYVVDASIQHRDPLPVVDGETSRIDQPAWGVTGHWVDGNFSILWRNFVTGDGLMECEFSSVGASAAEFSKRHEVTRVWSPFNFSLCVNLLRGQERLAAAWGTIAEVDQQGHATRSKADLAARRRFLIEEVGISEELAHQLPEDLEFAPPERN